MCFVGFVVRFLFLFLSNLRAFVALRFRFLIKSYKYPECATETIIDFHMDWFWLNRLGLNSFRLFFLWRESPGHAFVFGDFARVARSAGEIAGEGLEAEPGEFHEFEPGVVLCYC